MSEWIPELLEGTAVTLAIVYLLLAVKERLSCWYAAALSSGLFAFFFYFYANLLFQSLLNLFYFGMAIYGYLSWKGGATETQSGRRITSLPIQHHIVAIAIICTLSFAAGHLAQLYTDAKLPFLDAWTTFASIFTTWLVVRKVLENWIYWIVIDFVSIYLYLDRALYLTTALFCIYIVIAFFGWRMWRASYQLAK